MNVDSVDSRPRNILMQPTATNAVLGTLNKYETGYIIGVIAQLTKTNKSCGEVQPLPTNHYSIQLSVGYYLTKSPNLKCVF